MVWGDPGSTGVINPLTGYPSGANLSRPDGRISYLSVGTDGYVTTTFVYPSAAAVATSTGVNPTETSYSLYGHIIPISVFGKGRIGGEIIAGPWVSNGLASFIISFGFPADPAGTRDLREIAFDSEVVWDSVNGFSTEAFTYRFYGGTLTQTVDALETTHFGAEANAYRPQMLLAFENLPLAGTKFGKIPYVAAVIGDATGDDVNLGEAFERIAYSPWVGYTSAEFETVGVTDGLVGGGLIIAQDVDFLTLMQQFGRFYRSWDILQTDKLRIVDRGDDLTADIVFDKTGLMNSVVLARAEPNSVPRELELATIDPDADYTIVPSKARYPRDPVNVSASVGTETVYLPAIMDSSTRMAIVTYAKYQEEVARKRISATAMIYGLEIEPGDLIGITSLGDGFANDVYKIIETLHGANYSVEFIADAILRCEIVDADFAGVVLLMGFEGADAATGAPGMTDESSRAHGTALVNSAAQIDTSQFKYGSSSLQLTNFNNFISFDDSDDWTLSSANSDEFTVEAFVRFTSHLLRPNMIVGQSGTSTSAWAFSTSSTLGEFNFRSSIDGTTFNVDLTSSGAALSTGTWYHLAVDKDSTGKIRLYKNGTPVGSTTPANSSMINVVTRLYIGCKPGSNGVDGWIDEVRITKGIARYKTDVGFVPPAVAFPRS